QMRGGHQRLDRIATADLERHDAAEAILRVLLHQCHRARDGAAVGEALLADQRRAHVGDRRYPVVVSELGRRHQRNAMTFGVEPAHVEKAKVGAASPARAQDPGADGKRFDVVEGKLAQRQSMSSRTTRPAAVMARSVGTRHTSLTMAFAAGPYAMQSMATRSGWCTAKRSAAAAISRSDALGMSGSDATSRPGLAHLAVSLRVCSGSGMRRPRRPAGSTATASALSTLEG